MTEELKAKLDMIAKLFSDPIEENVEKVDNAPLQEGKYYGGVYNGRKFLYSLLMIETLPADKLEQFIRKQLGI